VETIGSKRSYALTWCMPNNDDGDDSLTLNYPKVVRQHISGAFVDLVPP